jgi:hypothetical protein
MGMARCPSSWSPVLAPGDMRPRRGPPVPLSTPTATYGHWRPISRHGSLTSHLDVRRRHTRDRLAGST